MPDRKVIAEVTTLRDLIRARRAAGWQHIVYGGPEHRDHIWRSPLRHTGDATPRRPARVTLYEGQLEYFRPGSSWAAGTIRADSIEEVVDFLRLYKLLDAQPAVAS